MWDIFYNLENYLRDHESILSEEKRFNRLTDDSLGYLLNHLCDYVYHEYSFNPTPNDIVEISEAIFELFPSLSSKGEHKIVSFMKYSSSLYFNTFLRVVGYFIWPKQ